MVKNLRMLRLCKGLSQQQLADIIGTSQQSINKYENHSVEPDIATLIKLADFFDTSIDFLVGRECNMEEKQVNVGFEMTREEISLLLQYRVLTPDEKKSIHLICSNYNKCKKPT